MKNTTAGLVFFVLLIYSGIAIGQSNGNVKGVIKDTSGAVLPGASITLTNKATQQSVQSLTNESGTYSFAFVTPGTYTLVVDMAGFRKIVRDGIIVNVAETVVLDLKAEVGDVSQEITVTGEAPLVQTTTTTLGRAIDQAVVTGMPLSSRNFTQILALS